MFVDNLTKTFCRHFQDSLDQESLDWASQKPKHGGENIKNNIVIKAILKKED